MSRTSSPGMYSRNSSKSMPRPLKWLRYAPTIVSFTRRLVRTSTRRTASRSSLIVMAQALDAETLKAENHTHKPLRHHHRIKYLLNDRIRRHRLRLRFVRKDESVAQHVRPDALHILRRYVSPPLQERPGLRRQCQI